MKIMVFYFKQLSIETSYVIFKTKPFRYLSQCLMCLLEFRKKFL